MSKSLSVKSITNFRRAWHDMLDGQEDGFDHVLAFMKQYDAQTDPMGIVEWTTEETFKHLTRFDRADLDQRISYMTDQLFWVGGWFDLDNNPESSLHDVVIPHQDRIRAINDEGRKNMAVVSTVFELLHHHEANAYALRNDPRYNYSYEVDAYEFGHDPDPRSNMAYDPREGSLLHISRNLRAVQASGSTSRSTDARLARTFMFLALHAINVPSHTPSQDAPGSYEGIYAGRVIGMFLDRLDHAATVEAMATVTKEFRSFLGKNPPGGLTVNDGEAWIKDVARGINLAVSDPTLRHQLLNAMGVPNPAPVSPAVAKQTSLPNDVQMAEIDARDARWQALPREQRPPFGEPPATWNDVPVVPRVPTLGALAKTLNNWGNASVAETTPPVVTDGPSAQNKTPRSRRT